VAGFVTALHTIGALGIIEQTAPSRAAAVGRGLKRLGVPTGDRHSSIFTRSWT
jgi:hypothetical protein